MTQPSTAYRVYGQWMFTTGDDGWTLVRVLRLCDVGPVVYDALHATIFGEWIRSWRPEEPGRWNMAQAFATDGCPVFGRLPSASVWWQVRDWRGCEDVVMRRRDVRNRIKELRMAAAPEGHKIGTALTGLLGRVWRNET